VRYCENIVCCSYFLLARCFVRPRDCNPGIPPIFDNPKSQDWQRLNPGILVLQKLAKIVFFHILNDRNKNLLPSGE